MNYTADEIRAYQFQKSGISGYKASEVDDLLDNVARDYDDMTKLTAEFSEKMQVLADKINEYRDNEDAVKEAILRAQKTGDEILRERKNAADKYFEEKTKEADNRAAEASEIAEKVVTEAQTKAQDLMDKSTMEAQRILVQAQNKAKNLSYEIEEKIKNETEAYNSLKQAVDDFKNELFDAYKKHMTLISAIKTKSYAAEHFDDKLSAADAETASDVKEIKPDPADPAGSEETAE